MKILGLAMAVAMMGCSDVGVLNDECARICGEDWFRCSIAPPDEPRGGRFRSDRNAPGPKTDFTLSYSGVICSFVYDNTLHPAENFSIGLRNAPTPPPVEQEPEDQPAEVNEDE